MNLSIPGDCFNQVWEDTQTWECHEERSLLYARNRRHGSLPRATWESTRVSQEAEGIRGKLWVRAFFVVSVGRNEGGKGEQN